jgi:ABC-type phosphate transport system substrate-binding protein
MQKLMCITRSNRLMGKTILLFGLLARVASGLILLMTVCAAQNSAIAVVVNKDNPVSQISLAGLRNLYLGEQRFWKGRLAVTALMRVPGAREREVALKIVFRMSESEYKAYWVDRVFHGQASAPPPELFSHGSAQDAVASIPGAVALVLASDVSPRVKVLKIDGHLPNEDGYPLQ